MFDMTIEFLHTLLRAFRVIMFNLNCFGNELFSRILVISTAIMVIMLYFTSNITKTFFTELLFFVVIYFLRDIKNLVFYLVIISRTLWIIILISIGFYTFKTWL
ncbi:hypothetical protein CFTD6856_08780 [Campylobacter fetus subsp. testudinum]|nr:hypothetical protein CFTD6690_08805 [Campylobacter fetus subsp. testudinum]OCS12242.1 hypothetical protein CFTD6856_08780 [Campylobacter fetus subsp. testudinum]